jgi:predicted permease
MTILNEFFRDIRFGSRLLLRNLGFALIAVLSLGLGIGGATAVFSLVNAIVLRTLPVPDPQQLYSVRVNRPAQQFNEIFSSPTFDQVRDTVAARGVELFAATSTAGMQLIPDGDEAPARGNVQLVSGEFFSVLRQQPQLGRLFSSTDNRTAGGHPVVVISDGYWRRRLNAAPDAVGRRLTINGTSFTIVGVTRPQFFGNTVALRNPDAWIPYSMQAVVRYNSNVSNSDDADPRKPWTPQPNIEWLNVFARVPANLSASAAAEGMTAAYVHEREAVMPRTATDEERTRLRQQRVELTDGSAGISNLRKGASQPLFVLLAMVGVLLIIACGNVAGLLLSRAAGREREVAIRLSMGASRLRLVRQFLAESLLLAAAACVVGITFAAWARDVLLALLVNVGSSTTPVDLNTGLDWSVLGFALAVSILTGILCGVLPAIRGTRVAVSESLKQQGRGAVGTDGGRRGMLVGKALVAAQMAFCLLLLVVAGLFTRSLRSLSLTDIGFDRDHVLTVRVDVRGAGYSSPERLALYQRVVERLVAVPGVRSASFSANGPLAGSARISCCLEIEGHTLARDEQIRTNEETVSERYFETVGLKLIDGRLFGAQDRTPGSPNTIINETMARRYFPNQSPLGKRWSYGGPIGKDSKVIIGVVEDARYVQVRTTPPNMAYHLAEAEPDDVLSDIEVRTTGAPGPLAQTVREVLTQTEPRLPIVEAVPLGDRIARDVSQDRMVARLTSVFGALALLLASLGLYGTISYGVSRRFAELGLRMALGADRGMVLRMVLREALLLVVAGAVIGVPLAFVAGRSMRALLFNVGAADPMSFGLGAGVLLLVAAVAAYLPAHRASRIEPMTALNRG